MFKKRYLPMNIMNLMYTLLTTSFTAVSNSAVTSPAIRNGARFVIRESADLPTFVILTCIMGITIPIIGIIVLLRAYQTRSSDSI